MSAGGDPPIGPVRTFVIAGTLALVVLVGGFGSWVAFASLSGAIILPGRIEQTLPNRPIQHPEGGRIAQVFVTEGDRVDAGQALLTLDGTALQSELAIVSARLVELRSRRARLLAERDDAPAIAFPDELTEAAPFDPAVAAVLQGQRRLFAARRRAALQEESVLQQKFARITSQIDGLEAQLAALETQASLVRAQLNSKRDLLARGLVANSTVQTLEQDLAGLTGRIGARASQRDEARLRLAEVELDRLRNTTRRREEVITQLRDLEFRQSELTEQRRALAARVAALSVRAPIAGIVLGADATSPGAVVQPGAVMMQIVPLDRRFDIVTRVPPTLVDQLYPGQPVRIRLATASAGPGPDLEGRITRISADALVETGVGARFYRTRVTLDQADARDLAARPDIMPGLPVQVSIETTRQPVWAYLAKPFAIYFSRALHES